jgi:ribonuclease P/MRP protein subunit POP1
MHLSCCRASATTRAFQSLPRHLRRRAASHNPRRVPKRLREKAAFEVSALRPLAHISADHICQIDSKDNTVKSQKKRAKAKAKFLKKKGLTKTNIYLKRQGERERFHFYSASCLRVLDPVDKTWLETHVWHAKRMKMENVWGYRIVGIDNVRKARRLTRKQARTPNRKSHRPAHRAAHSGCIIHDASYYSTVELSGDRDELLEILSSCTAGGTFAGSRYETGGRMAEVTLHRYREWPAGMIGPAEILWRPQQTPSTSDRKGKRKQVGNPVEDSAKKRHLWIRIHPAIFDETHKTLVKAISSYYQRREARSADGDIGVEMKDLRGTMNSFEIMGPRAVQILEGILDPCRTDPAPKKAVSREARCGPFHN